MFHVWRKIIDDLRLPQSHLFTMEKKPARCEDYPLRDSHDHFIVHHDLFNHEGLTRDGIAEAFREFAKREQLSFFR